MLKKKNSSNIPITPSFLCKTHNVGFGWIFIEMGGKFRKINVKVSQHQPPPPYLIQQLMDDLCKDIKVRINHLPSIKEPDYISSLIQLLAWSHHRFLWIHPFVDYNGRIGRLLINIILLNLNLPPIELRVETKIGRDKYIVALQDADNGDYYKIERLVQLALEEAARELE